LGAAKNSVDTDILLFYDISAVEKRNGFLNLEKRLTKRGQVGIAEDLNARTIEVRLANKLGYERVAMACSASFAQMMGLPPERIEDLKTMVAEAAINAMEHGNKGRPDAKVVVWMNCQDNLINVSVMDEGEGITIFPPKPDIEKIIEDLESPVGFGLFLIEQLADQVEFNREANGGHVVRMAIKMSP
jgi:serine/threonine-protein kinase RsbW